MKRVKLVIATILGVVCAAEASNKLEQLRHRYHGPELKAVLYSPNGKLFVAGGPDLIVLDAKSRKELATLDTKGMEVVALDISANSKIMCALLKSYNRTDEVTAQKVAVYALPSGRLLTHFEVLGLKDNNRMRRISFDPTTKKVAVCNGERLAVFSLSSGKEEWSFSKPEDATYAFNYSAFDATPDWKYFLFNLQRVAYPSKETLGVVKWDEKEKFHSHLIAPDGETAIVSGSWNCRVLKQIDLKRGEVLKEIKTEGGNILLADAGFGTILQERVLWDLSSNEMVALPTYNNFSGRNALAISPDGKELTLATVYIQRPAESVKVRPTDTTHWFDESVNGISAACGFGHAEGELVIGSRSKRRLNLETGKVSKRFQPPYLAHGAAMSPDGTLVLRGSGSLEFPDGKEPVTLLSKEQKKSVSFKHTAFCPTDERGLLVGDKGVILVDLQNQKVLEIQSFKKKKSQARSICSRDGYFVALISGDLNNSKFSLYDTNLKKFIVEDETSEPYILAFSRDGTKLVRALGQSIEVLDLSTMEKVAAHTLDDGAVKALLSSPFTDTLLVVNKNGHHRVCELMTGKTLYTVAVATGDQAIVFDAKGKRVVETEDLGNLLQDSSVSSM